MKEKNGPDACPFNYLYWDFLVRNRDQLQSNHRVSMMYKTYDRMNEDKKNAIRHDSQKLLDTLSQWTNLTCQLKYAWYAGVHLVGEKNGEKFGMKSSIALKNVEIPEDIIRA